MSMQCHVMRFDTLRWRIGTMSVSVGACSASWVLPPLTGTTAHHGNLCARIDPRGKFELLFGHAVYGRGWVLRSWFVFSRPKVESQAQMQAVFTGSAAFLKPGTHYPHVTWAHIKLTFYFQLFPYPFPCVGSHMLISIIWWLGVI
jgi:hypothetical protein